MEMNMDKLQVPERILSSEEIKRLSPSERDAYIQNVILEVLGLNKYVTVSQIDEQLHFSRPTATKHLEMLTAIGEAYRIQMGNLAVYSKNGKVVHEADVQSIVVYGKTYTFYKLKNQEGDFLYIQEKILDELGSPKVKGGIMINSRDLPIFLEKLQAFVNGGEAKWLET
jgi:DNA-binding transcriptional ArsR family regulator